MTGSLTGRIVRGIVAGAVGTVAMDYLRYRSQDTDAGFVEHERSEMEDFGEAPAPAKFGRMAAEAVGVDVPESAAGDVNDLVHWLTGTGYGVLSQSLLIDDRRNPAASALATGVGAWLNAYVVLAALGLYKPMWEYDADQLLDDLKGHLVYGAATAFTYRALGLLSGD
jgi:hypothetical protein